MLNKKTSLKILKILLGMIAVLILISFILLFMKSTVASGILTALDSQLYLNNNNIHKWANFTDDGTINIYAKIRFYGLTPSNSRDKALSVKETPEVIFRNIYKYYDVSYLNNGNEVAYRREVTPVSDQKVKPFNAQIINFLGITFWHRVKTLSEEDRAIMALSSIVSGIGLNISKQLKVGFLFKVFDKFGEYATRFMLTRNLSVDSNTAHIMIIDPYFGLKTQTGLLQWMDTYDNKITQQLIADYFNIQLKDVLKAMNNLSYIISIAKKYINYELSCGDNNCNAYNLLVRQWAKSEISMALLSKPSLADGETLFGLPEYNAFYLERFSKVPGFENSGLTIEQAKSLLKINLDSLDYSKDWNNLVHKGNIYDIFSLGRKYEESKDENYLKLLVNRFALKNNEQAFILYSYLKYLADEFITSRLYGGNIEITTFTALYAEYSKKVFFDLVKFFREEFLLTFFTNWALEQHTVGCTGVIKDSIKDISQKNITELCQEYNDRTKFFASLYSYCVLEKEDLFALSPAQKEMMCNTYNKNANSYDYIKSTMNLRLNFFFAAFDPINLAILQFVEARITQVNCPYTSEKYPQAESVWEWDKKRFRTRFELYLIAIDNDIDPYILVGYNGENFKKLMNDMRLFSQPVINMAIINNRKGTFQYFDKLFGIYDPEFFEIYIKSFVRSFVLGGKYITIDEQEALDGISFPLFTELKNKPVLLGGDPSIDEKFSIVKPSKGTTKKYSGKDNIKKIDNFFVFNDSSKITVPLPYFNGNHTVTNYVQPWKEETPVTGCEIICEPYDKDESSLDPSRYKHYDLNGKHITYYQDVIGRTLQLKYTSHRTVAKNGFGINKYNLDNDQLLANKANKNYYQNKYNGAFNVTSVVGGPFFMTKNRFLDADTSITKYIEFFDEDGRPANPRSDIDDIYFETEKYSNACTTNNVNLQLNIKVDKNEIFEYHSNPDILYPVVNIYGLQQMEDSFVSVKFSELVPIYRILGYYYIYLFLCILILVIIGYGVWFWIKKIEKEGEMVFTEEYLDNEQNTEAMLNK